MTYQLVLSGNRILAHGEAGCFLAMGGTVICEEKGKAYPNATVVTHEGGLPADIDKVGYEYHAGVFIPCAPYGTGAGDILVACEDCGTPKRSGYNSALLKYLTDFMMSKGAAGGLATLDSTGKVPSNQIPLLEYEIIDTKTYTVSGNRASTNSSTFSLEGLKEFIFDIAFTSSGSGECYIQLYADSTKVYTSSNFSSKAGVMHGVKTSFGWILDSKTVVKNTSINKLTYQECSYPAGTYTLTLYGVRE